MATVHQLTMLFKYLAGQDVEGAFRVARQIADDEEKRGHRTAAQSLRGAINPNGHTRAGWSVERATPMAQPAGLVISEMPGPPIAEVALRPKPRRLLEDVALEWRHRERLAERGISRRSRLLFCGPPGCGKTLTARALGREFGVPVRTARMSSVIGAYLGQTGQNLRQLFSLAHDEECILLLDEFDALARKRGGQHDIGELDRVVISMLQELDHSSPSGMVIAATNLPESIDPALWRRFDAVVEFPRPNRRELERFVRERIADAGLKLTRAQRDSVLQSRTYAEVDTRLLDEIRRRALAEMAR